MSRTKKIPRKRPSHQSHKSLHSSRMPLMAKKEVRKARNTAMRVMAVWMVRRR